MVFLPSSSSRSSAQSSARQSSLGSSSSSYQSNAAANQRNGTPTTFATRRSFLGSGFLFGRVRLLTPASQSASTSARRATSASFSPDRRMATAILSASVLGVGVALLGTPRDATKPAEARIP